MCVCEKVCERETTERKSVYETRERACARERVCESESMCEERESV